MFSLSASSAKSLRFTPASLRGLSPVTEDDCRVSGGSGRPVIVSAGVPSVVRKTASVAAGEHSVARSPVPVSLTVSSGQAVVRQGMAAQNASSRQRIVERKQIAAIILIEAECLNTSRMLPE